MTTATRTRRSTAAAPAAKFDPYQAVTDQIIALLQAGTAPWRRPWDPTTGIPRSLSTSRPYRGINPFLLGISAAAAGFTSPLWGTYNAITEHGGQVRKGSQGTLVIFWKSYPDKTEVNPRTGKPLTRFVLRTYKVFNAEQADPQDDATAAARWSALTATPTTTPAPDPIPAAQALADAYLTTPGAPTLSHGAAQAAYSPTRDHLQLPARTAFTTPAEYYSTLFHELAHSTGHQSRLARPGVTEDTHFGDNRYAKEELVAEFTSAFLAAQAGIFHNTQDNSAAYLASWISVLQADNRLVVQAAAQAQRAADLVQGITFAREQTAEQTEEAAA